MVLGDLTHFERKVKDFGNYSHSWKLLSFLDIILTFGYRSH